MTHSPVTHIALNISNTAIHHIDGLYSLNDLHMASGNEQKHKPANWLRSQQAIELIELLKSEQLNIIIQKQGFGTFGAKELVYAYAMWISPRFHLAVIRAYDALVCYSQLMAPEADYLEAQEKLKTSRSHLAALQAELLKLNPRLQDVLNLTRLGYSRARISAMLGLSHSTVFRSAKRLRECGFVVCADAVRLPVQGGV